MAEGVLLLELRYSPSYICQNHPDLSMDSVHAAVLKGVNKARYQFAEKIRIGLTVCSMRVSFVHHVCPFIVFLV